MNWHVLPINDLRPHVEVGEYCHCEPKVIISENGNKVVVHNAYDGRDKVERLIDDVYKNLN